MPDALFLPAEIVAVDDLSDEGDPEAALFCACCGFALSEDVIKTAEGDADLCAGCDDDARHGDDWRE